ncbi:hypothetical protein [Pseudoalteromonas luteoviolacea]|uniref:Uncharacterized protein n=1 Tax=Pseudoalteromonas luteoviolacea S4060-1 TaxID=1365257 RepID=A0A167P0R7_9GAMM|nr:hypothetical protein [Pseudoalteromonas luteoviolacea]KZN69246.1 hypothetical protein N478_11475 [Pseudoalteromonas luteoviolacea S4060-1]
MKKQLIILVITALHIMLLGCSEAKKDPQNEFNHLSQAPIDLGVISSDAATVAFLNGGLVTVSDVRTTEVKHQFKLHNHTKVSGISLSQDNKLLLVSFDTQLSVWDLNKNSLVGQFTVAGHSEFAKISQVAIYANPMCVLVGMTDGTLNLIDFENNLTKQAKLHEARISHLEMGEHRQLVMTAGHDGQVKLSYIDSLSPKYSYSLSKRVTSAATGLRNEILFVSDALNEQVLLRPFSNMSEPIKLVYRERFRWFRAAALSPNGEYLATGSSKYWWTLWDANNGREIDAFAIESATSTAMILDMHFSKDNILTTLSSDGIVEFWDINTLASTQH